MTLGTGDKQAIETLQIGQRVLTPEAQARGGDNETGRLGEAELVGAEANLRGSETAVDPATWRSYTVRLRDGVTGWDVFDITLLRPQGWIEAQSREVAGHAEVC